MNKYLLALSLGLSLFSMSTFAGGGLVASFDIHVNAFAKNLNNNVIYATTSNNSVVIIDMGTLTITDTIFVGQSPAGLALAQDGQTLYVALTGDNKIAIVDLTTKAVSTIDLPAPAFDVEVGNGYLYATPNDQTIFGIMQINLTTHEVTDFNESVFISLKGLLEISPDKNSLYFANTGLSPGTLAKFDITVNPPTLLYKNPHGSLGGSGKDLLLTADGQHIYYVVSSGNAISGNYYDIAQLETVDFTASGSFQTGAYPQAITSSPDGKVIYSVHTSDHIDVWDANTFLKITEYLTDGQASELIVDESGNFLLAAFDSQLRIYTTENGQILRFSAATYSVSKADASAVIEVTRDNSRDVATVDYSTSDGTAEAGSDYTAVSGTLTYAIGQTTASFTVPILADSEHEADETVLLNLSNPNNGAVLGSPASAALTIRSADVLTQNYFPLTPGIKWQYLANGSSHLLFEVPFESVSINKVKTRTVKTGIYGRKYYYSNDSQGIRLHRLYFPKIRIYGHFKRLSLTASPPVLLAAENAEAGQTFYSEGNLREVIPDIGSGLARYTATYTVLGDDTITVPAGTGNVIKLQGSILVNGQTLVSQTLYLAKNVGIVKQEENSFGVVFTSELIKTNTSVHDLAITAIIPPYQVILSAKKPEITKTVKVILQNRSPLLETITDSEMLGQFVDLNVESLGLCPEPTVKLLTEKLQKRMPINLKPKQTVSVDFAVTFNCANDPEANTSKNPGHQDYRYTATVNGSVLSGYADIDEEDDVCPRSVTPPYVIDNYPDRKIKDRGCGMKKPDKTFGADVVTDLIGP